VNLGDLAFKFFDLSISVCVDRLVEFQDAKIGSQFGGILNHVHKFLFRDRVRDFLDIISVDL